MYTTFETYTNPLEDFITMSKIIFWVAIILLIICDVIGAYLMSKSAKEKGYGDDAHIMAICFWLGIFGYLYTLNLPDKKLQEQNQKILDSLKYGTNEKDSDDELPEL